MRRIATIEDIKSVLNRFVSYDLDESRILPYIEESENLYIKNQIGNSLYADILSFLNTDDKSKFKTDYKMLLDGGIYEYKDNCGKTQKKMFEGLTKCTSYYVWAKLVFNNNYSVTRFGFVQKKDSEYSTAVSEDERNNIYRDALIIADNYLKECILYLENNRDKYKYYNKSRISSRYQFITFNK